MLWGLVVVSLVACLAITTQNVLAEEPAQYNGFTVVRAVPTTTDQLELLYNLAGAPENEAPGMAREQIDFWRSPTTVNQPVDMMINPDISVDLLKMLDDSKVPHVTMIKDVQNAIKEENRLPLELLMSRAGSFFNSYHRLGSIHNHLKNLASTYPEIASTFSVGKSAEKRDLLAIRITSNQNGTSKPIIWIDGGIHAREWISPATVTYIATQLVELHSSDPNVKQLVDKFEWIILPVTNPDGYEFTHTNTRMWRKTRSQTNSLWGCQGADPNRNFGFHWNEGGSSNNPCADTYAGPRAFSEPETKAVSDYLLTKKGRLCSFISVHSYSQLWLTPWGWTSAYPKDYQEMKMAADVAVQALSRVHGTKYTVGTSTNVLYVASGGSDDWAYGVAGAKYSYTVELRDTGSYGFILPANQILPTGQETWEGVKAFAQYISNKV